ncbi:hypothetical protein AB0N09_17450 [Streptomyces erythrochromogenes]|uniref:hypothetical protein n=1 Tax=Streptomyces TaxID=1883 RepID=UPI00343DAADF
MTDLYAQATDRYLRELTGAGLRPVLITHKWQRPDLIAPHSDLDLRLILSSTPPSWANYGDRLFRAHSRAVAADPLHARLLEHPPGFIFTTSELDAGLVQPAEVVTWSVAHGEHQLLEPWVKGAESAPWTTADARFYGALLKSRIGGRYRLGDDSADNVTGDLADYARHCVAWHYVAPCWFAAACLSKRTRLQGKLEALVRWRPQDAARHAELFSSHSSPARSRPALPVDELLRSAHAAVDAATRLIRPSDQTVPSEDPATAAVRTWTMTAGMLRTKTARWRYYLTPPPGVHTNYLIAREAKELSSARDALQGLALSGPVAHRGLAGAMADLLPPQGTTTTASTLRDLLTRWTVARSVVQDFLSGPITQVRNPNS